MLADLTERRQQGLLSCTSQTCSWLQPRQRNLSPKVMERPLRPAKTCSNASGKVVVNFSRLRNRLVKSAPACGYLSVTADPSVQPKDKEVRYALPDPSFIYRDNVDLSSESCVSQFEMYRQSLVLTEEEKVEIERGTRGQATNFLWTHARCGCTSAIL